MPAVPRPPSGGQRSDDAPGSRHVAVRIDAPTLARVDALIPGLSSAWHTAKRSDALRFVIGEGLDAIARKAKKGGAS
jgi:hypothetical protein